MFIAFLPKNVIYHTMLRNYLFSQMLSKCVLSIIREINPALIGRNGVS